MLPHVEAIPLCTLEFEVSEGTSCSRISKAPWIHPVQTTLGGKFELLTSEKISMISLKALLKDKGCPRLCSMFNKVDEAQRVLLEELGRYFNDIPSNEKNITYVFKQAILRTVG